MAKRSKLVEWWQSRTGEEETPFDTDSSAFLLSVMVHVAILVALGLWPLLANQDDESLVITTTKVDVEEITETTPPEQIHFSEQAMAEIGANSDLGTQMALSEAPVIAEISEIPNLKNRDSRDLTLDLERRNDHRRSQGSQRRILHNFSLRSEKKRPRKEPR